MHLPSVLGTPQNDFYLAKKSLKIEMKIRTNALNCIAWEIQLLLRQQRTQTHIKFYLKDNQKSTRKDFSGRLASNSCPLALCTASVHVSDEGCCCVNGGCSAILTASRACGYLCASAVRPFITSSICWCHYSRAFGEKRARAHNKIKLEARQRQPPP